MTGYIMFDAGLFLILLVVVIVVVDRIMWLREMNSSVDVLKKSRYREECDRWEKSLDLAKERGDFRE